MPEAVKPGSLEGKSVDFRGNPAVEPSENVKALSEASNKRQDDLRIAAAELFACRIECLKEVIALRALHSTEINDAESRRVNEQLELRARYAERLETAEAKRIDAIRSVDVNAVSVASQRASDQATVLANQVAQSAEALRSLVASAANTVSQSQQQLATTLSTRITTLEQAGYQAAGKQSYADPAFLELLAEVKGLREARRETVGVSQGIGTTWGAIGVVAGILVAMAGVGFAITRPASQPQPVVQYVPAPTSLVPAPVTVPR